MRSFGLASALWLSVTGAAVCQPPPATTPAAPQGAVPQPQDPAPRPGEARTQDPQQPKPLDETTRAALEGLAEQLDRRRLALQTAVERGDAKAIASLEQEVKELRWQFAELASHLDVEQFEEPKQERFDVIDEVYDLVRPLMRAMKEATSGPRQVAELEDRLEAVRERRRVAQLAAEQVRATRDALDPQSDAYEEVERELQQRWEPLLNELGSEILVLNANLQRLRDEQQPLVTSVTDTVQRFLQSSGLSLVLSVLVFVAVYFGLRFVGDRLLRRRRRRAEFSVRLFEVLVQVATLLVAVAATLVVPYARNDWLLLGVAIVFLLGAGWVVVKMAPQFVEQFRLILNVGPVREGERILIGGLPFRVDALRFQSRLVNPELAGGALRVPVKELIGQRSRPIGEGEPWFPCRQGDVVALADGTVGVVKLQTPEVVLVAERHDAPKSYPTTAFLQQNPRNLSRGFEIVLRFGLDYRHQQDATDKVPQALQRAVHDGLAAITAPGQLRHVHVELTAAGSSSLDFAVIVELDGSAAERYHELSRRVNVLLVAACNEHGFGIPFPQLTVHRGGAATPARG